MLFMLLLHVEDSLEYLLLVFQSLPFFRQPLDLVFQVLILRHYLLLLATEMSNDVGFFESLQVVQLLSQPISLITLPTDYFLDSSILFPFWLKTFFDSFFISPIHFYETMLQFFQSCKEVIATSSELAIQFIIILLQIDLLFFELSHCEFLSASGIICQLICFLLLLKQPIELSLQLSHRYLQLFRLYKQLLILKIIFFDVILDQDQFQGPRGLLFDCFPRGRQLRWIVISRRLMH